MKNIVRIKLNIRRTRNKMNMFSTKMISKISLFTCRLDLKQEQQRTEKVKKQLAEKEEQHRKEKEKYRLEMCLKRQEKKEQMSSRLGTDKVDKYLLKIHTFKFN